MRLQLCWNNSSKVVVDNGGRNSNFFSALCMVFSWTVTIDQIQRKIGFRVLHVKGHVPHAYQIEPFC